MPGVYLLDRTSDASHNRSVFTMAGEHGPVADALERPGRRRRSTRSTWTTTPASTRGSGPSTSSRSCRWRRRRWTTASSSPGPSARGIADRFDLPVYLYANAATRPERVKLADVRRGQYEGLKARDRAARPRARLRAGAAAPVGRRGRGRRAAVPDRLQHQPRLAPTSSWPSGSPGGSASRAAACRGSRPTASGSRSSAAPRSR